MDHLAPLYTSKTFRGFSDAVFRLLLHGVETDCVSVFYRNAGDRMLQERDSRGREYGAAFSSRHAELTPAIALGAAQPGIKMIPTRTGLSMPEEQLRESALYKEVMQVQGWRHAVALCFWDDPPASFPVLVFSVKRTQGEPDFSDEDLAALEVLHGFIAPAVRRMQDQAAATSVYDAMASPLQHEVHGVVVLDSRLRIVRANRAGRRLLASLQRTGRARAHEDVCLPPEVVHACREMNDERLAELRAEGAASGTRRRRRRVAVGNHTLAVAITMIGREVNGLVEPSYVVQLSDVSATESGPTSAPPLTFPPVLTTSERAVASALAQGLSNQEIADRLGKSLHAVKFLLHSIYRKTGVTNRARLVVVVRGWTDLTGGQGTFTEMG